MRFIHGIIFLFVVVAGPVQAGAEQLSIYCDGRALQSKKGPDESLNRELELFRERSRLVNKETNYYVLNFEPNDPPDLLHSAAWLCSYHPLTTMRIPIFNMKVTGRIQQSLLEPMGAIFQGLLSAEDGLNRPFGSVLMSLNSPGGNMKVAKRLGEGLFDMALRVKTRVEENNICASACVVILAAGVDRHIRGKVGIHRIYFHGENGVPNSNTDYINTYRSELANLKNYFEKMGVRASLVDEMLRYSSDDVHYLTDRELRFYGLNDANPYLEEKRKGEYVSKCGIDWYQKYEDRLQGAFKFCSQESKYADDIFKCVDPIVHPVLQECPAIFGGN